MMAHRRAHATRHALPALAMACGVILAGCGDDDEDTVAQDPSTTAAASTTVDIVGIDYAFEGVPESVPTGTELAFTNTSDSEVHELVLLRLAEGEDRPLDELLALPPEEQMTIGEVRGVELAFPGEDGIAVDGALVVDEPGRYVLVCAIPQGADPAAYRDALQDPDASGPPDVPGGPPHLVLGMAAETTVG